MVFSSLVFLWLFLPFTLLVYGVLRRPDWRNLFLLAMSLIFYAWGEPRYVLIMVFSILLNYGFGRLIEKSSRPRLVVSLGILANLSLLGYYKYINFAIDNLNLALNLGLEFEDIALPIGISFYTFQAVSYLVDIYRGQVKAQKNPVKMGLYIAFFPQLIAGPIVKYHDIEQQINARRVTLDEFSYGTQRFVIGLAKKVLLANILGALSDTIIDSSPDNLVSSVAWLGIIAYGLQIFYDFSGYSDMAIGLGRMFGFTFQENFNAPYVSKSIKEFWRRWHISLSTWFKEYLYIPLGGSRAGDLKTYRNLLIVFFATGLWHGASWNFVFWGMWHGTFIVLEKAFQLEKRLHWRIFQHFYALLVVFVGWVFFRLENFAPAVDYLNTMFNFSSFNVQNLALYLNKENSLALLVGILCSGCCNKLLMQELPHPLLKLAARVGSQVVLLFVLYFSFVYLAGSSYNPFIYFRF